MGEERRRKLAGTYPRADGYSHDSMVALCKMAGLTPEEMPNHPELGIVPTVAGARKIAALMPAEERAGFMERAVNIAEMALFRDKAAPAEEEEEESEQDQVYNWALAAGVHPTEMKVDPQHGVMFSYAGLVKFAAAAPDQTRSAEFMKFVNEVMLPQLNTRHGLGD